MISKIGEKVDCGSTEVGVGGCGDEELFYLFAGRDVGEVISKIAGNTVSNLGEKVGGINCSSGCVGLSSGGEVGEVISKNDEIVVGGSSEGGVSSGGEVFLLSQSFEGPEPLAVLASRWADVIVSVNVSVSLVTDASIVGLAAVPPEKSVSTRLLEHGRMKHCGPGPWLPLFIFGSESVGSRITPLSPTSSAGSVAEVGCHSLDVGSCSTPLKEPGLNIHTEVDFPPVALGPSSVPTALKEQLVLEIKAMQSQGQQEVWKSFLREHKLHWLDANRHPERLLL